MLSALVAVLGILDEFLQEGSGERLNLPHRSCAVKPCIVLDSHHRVASLGCRILICLPASMGGGGNIITVGFLPDAHGYPDHVLLLSHNRCLRA